MAERKNGEFHRRTRLLLSIIVFLAIADWTVTNAAFGGIVPVCRGDCDGDGEVGVNELIRGVQIALGEASVDSCVAVDSDGDGMVELFELIGAVNSALSGCVVGSPTAVPSGLASPTAGTATPSATPGTPMPTVTGSMAPTEIPTPTSTAAVTVSPAVGTATSTAPVGQTTPPTALRTPTFTPPTGQTAAATATATVRVATSTAGPSSTAPPSSTITQTRTPTLTATPANTLTVTPTATSAAPGPVITYLGIARATGSVTQPVGTATDGTPIFERPLPHGFFLVVEAKQGRNNRPVATSTFNSVQGNPHALPDLQIVVSRPLGNGSAIVCDSGPFEPIGGVPATDPAMFGGTQASANAINDLSCRFSARLVGSDGGIGAGPCTRNANGDGAFVRSDTRVQFCPSSGVGAEIAFPVGDTRVTVQVNDVQGQAGPPASIVVRIQ